LRATADAVISLRSRTSACNLWPGSLFHPGIYLDTSNHRKRSFMRRAWSSLMQMTRDLSPSTAPALPRAWPNVST